MKTTGNTILIEKDIKGKKNYYLKIREYNRSGEFAEADIFCRLTQKAKEQIKICDFEECEIPIEIKDSFYSVDIYYKDEEKYTKPTLVLSDIEIC